MGTISTENFRKLKKSKFRNVSTYKLYAALQGSI